MLMISSKQPFTSSQINYMSKAFNYTADLIGKNKNIINFRTVTNEDAINFKTTINKGD